MFNVIYLLMPKGFCRLIGIEFIFLRTESGNKKLREII